jgi:threonine dehydrogenase-like Zn-dependent dehydrogenase
MRAPFQEGDFPAPVKYGYLSVGVVEQGPPELEGRTVFCLYPHQTRYVVPAAAVVPVPAGLPPERAVLAGVMETAVNALWDAPPLVGDRVTVVGAGLVGCCVAAVAARVPGVGVELVDVDPSRAAVAMALGAGFALPHEASGDRDLVVHASASAAGLRRALELAGYVEFRERQAAARYTGRYVGIGIACMVEETGVGAFESALVRVDARGGVQLVTGSASQGQGHATAFAQLVADELEVDASRVTVLAGDTALIAAGGGTYASRSGSTGGGAARRAARKVRERARIVAAGVAHQSLDPLLDRRMRVEQVGEIAARIVDAHFHHGGIGALEVAAAFDLA